MEILIFGKGFIANKFKSYFGDKAEISDLRIEDYSALILELERKQPQVVLNCAGKTGKPNVDWCEDHRTETLFGNVMVPLLLARACEELGLYMVHIGSGCVYEGSNGLTGYSEEDEPNFDGSYYSKTKAWSEEMLKDYPVLQLRLRMPLDTAPGERNFITKITRYTKVISIQNSISVLEDFLYGADQLISKRATGIYNMTNPGTIDHKTILDMYIELVDPSFKYDLMSLEELEKITKARRSNCLLSANKLEQEGIFLRPIEQAVRESLIEYRNNMESGGTT